MRRRMEREEEGRWEGREKSRRDTDDRVQGKRKRTKKGKNKEG